MPRDPLAEFADIIAPGAKTPAAGDKTDFYPGSRRRRRAVTKTAADEESMFGVKARWLKTHGGAAKEPFYMIGVLAQALEREPGTIRKWQRLGYIPESVYVVPSRTKQGQKRLYSRKEIEILVRIAHEEGLIGESNRNVSTTRFPERARAALEALHAS